MLAGAEAHAMRLTSPGPLDAMAMEVDGITFESRPQGLNQAEAY